jgi:hypothetical protein
MRRRVRETKELMALAYRDAVRDILASDGRFQLADEQSRDAVWEWDGVTWSRIPLVDRGRPSEQPPFIEVEREEDLAVAG